MIVDMHTHFFPKPLIEMLSKHPEHLGLEVEQRDGAYWLGRPSGLYSPLDPGLYDPNVMLAAMKAHGVDAHVLSLAPVVLNLPATKESLRFCREANDFAAEFCRQYPNRFWAMATVPLPNVEAAIAELERAADLGLVGVEICSTVNGVPLDQPELLPFFRRAAELLLPVFIHPHHPVATANLSDYYFVNTIGYPVETTIAIARLVHGGVTATLPNLRLCAAHGGGFYPYQRGRFEHAWRVRVEPKKNLRFPPSAYQHNLAYDSITHDALSLAFLVQAVGAGQVLLGSDYPYDMGPSDPLAALREADLDSDAWSAITEANSKGLFHLWE